MELLTIDDFDLKGKKVLLRVDINSPLDPRSGGILDTTRIRGYVPDLERLSGSKVVVLAHQSRPGKSDFTTLERHAQVLAGMLKRKVRYVDDVFGGLAKRAISELKDGEVLVLENVRFCSEEVCREITARPPIEQAKTNLVKKLSSYVDFYVNDAFAVSHRSQPSIVAFPAVLPSCIGPAMEREIKTLSKVLESQEGPKVFALGGAKADDSFLITKNVLTKGIADRVLLSGVIGIIFLAAAGAGIGKANKRLIHDLGFDEYISQAKELLTRFKDKIALPVDMAYEKGGRRAEAPSERFPDKQALDIGSKTIKAFSEEARKAKIIVANGPAGVFEMNGFGLGTERLLDSISRSKALSVIGGGHLTTVADAGGFRDSITHISSGGGACVSFLSGQPLPGLEALKKPVKEGA
ncbi:MAG: phosphoglycerate kinase [Methanobacteriota archaeon]|nr:MAG: phosphoglycerate kinase [Euryarchaeota archaeon]